MAMNSTLTAISLILPSLYQQAGHVKAESPEHGGFFATVCGIVVLLPFALFVTSLLKISNAATQPSKPTAPGTETRSEPSPSDVGSTRDGDEDPVAVVGFSFTFPGGVDSSAKFWDILANKKCTVSEFPQNRMSGPGFFNPSSNAAGHKWLVKGGSFIEDDLSRFDAPFFTITPAEATDMDPQQRILLETSYKAFENAGVTLERAHGSKTAVFTASCTSDYKAMFHRDGEHQGKYAAAGISSNMLANRISWFFNLRGPSLNLDTACSSSLVAFHLACQEVQNGDSEMALVGGCNLLFDPDILQALSNLGVLSPDSQCFSFDHRANGYGRGEGVGVLVLKKLSKALRDNDTIRAVIRGTGSNQDGHTPGIFLPSADAQERLIKETYCKSGLDFDETGYFEAHGTATVAGDPLETEAIGKSFNAHFARPTPLYVGSVKSNIGHLEGTSGIAGLLKSILVLEHGLIPPIAGFEQLNPRIKSQPWSLRFPEKIMPWPTSGIRRVSVSSFGFGGTNAHAILDDAHSYLTERGLVASHNTTIHARTSVGSTADVSASLTTANSLYAQVMPTILTWSSVDEAGISRLSYTLTEYLKTVPKDRLNYEFLQHLAYTVNHRRSLFSWRSFTLVDSLTTIQQRALPVSAPTRAIKNPNLAFVFTGQGAQWACMGKELLRYPIFRKSIVAADRFLYTLGCDWSLLDELLAEESVSRINDASRSQPICTALQIALVDLLQDLGVSPKLVIGHSSGEIAAAYCTGGLSKESAWTVAYFRGLVASRFSRLSSQRGSMMSVGLSAAEVQMHLSRFAYHSDEVPQIGCKNSPGNTTITGHVRALDAFEKYLLSQNVFVRRLRVDVPYHSSYLSDIASEYGRYLENLTASTVRRGTCMISTVTKGSVGPEQLCQSKYWVKNLVSPVEFSESFSNVMSFPLNDTTDHAAVDSVPKQAFITDVVEIGPHSALQGPIRQICDSKKAKAPPKYHSIMIRHQDAIKTLLECSGTLHCRGHSIDLNRINNALSTSESHPRMLVDLPGYQFDHSRSFWRESSLSAGYRLRSPPRNAFLGVPVPNFNPLHARWRHLIRREDEPWLEDHVIDGSVLYPAAGMLVMAIEGAKQLADASKRIRGFQFKDIAIERSIEIPAEGTVEAELHIRRLESTAELSWSEFHLYTLTGSSWTQNSHGQIAIQYEQKPNDVDAFSEDLWFEQTRLFAQATQRNCSLKCDIKAFYEALEESRLGYGPTFQTMQNVTYNMNFEAVSDVILDSWKSKGDASAPDKFTIHPASLDGIFQLPYPSLSCGGENLIPTHIPTGIKRMWIANEALQGHNNRFVHASAKSEFRGYRESHTWVTALHPSTSEVLVIVDDLEQTAIGDNYFARSRDDSEERRLAYQVESKPDIDLLSSAEFELYCQNHCSVKEEPTVFYRKLRLLIYIFIRRTLRDLSRQSGSKMLHYYKKYINWMEHQTNLYRNGLLPFSEAGWDELSFDQNLLDNLCEEIENFNAEGKLYVTAGRNLLDILLQRKSAVELFFTNSLVADAYREHAASNSIKWAAKYVDLLAHKNPGMKILEIGAGTGYVSDEILKVIGNYSDETPETLRFSQYDYTDISKSFFEAVAQRHQNLGSKLRFQTLDIEDDPVSQGFAPNSYDLIIAAEVLHATRNLTDSLRNVRKLLKPGGKLMVFEVTQPLAMRTGFAYGLLDGWWKGTEADRQLGPSVTAGRWNDLLRNTGFSGVEREIYDFFDPHCREHSFMLSTAMASETVSKNVPRTIIVALEASGVQKDVAQHLLTALRDIGGNECDILSPLEASGSSDLEDAFCIFLVEMDNPILGNVDAVLFKNIQKLLTSAKGFVWATLGGGVEQMSPCFTLSTGLIRCLRSENIHLKATNVALEPHHMDPKHQSDILLKVYTENLAKNVEDCEVEYIERGGQLEINRVTEMASVEHEVAERKVKERREVLPVAQCPNFTLDIESPGLLDTFFFKEHSFSTTTLDSQEVEVEVKACGLNFRDCLVTLGRLADDSFGFEASGVILRVGDDCAGLKAGDRVCMSVVGGSFKKYIRCDKNRILHLPDSISYVQGASLPITTSTAYYALKMVAKLKSQESVLIHSGAGGTGQAAIQLAQLLGAEIFTTVGNLEKKKLLMDVYNIPEDHILYSRDTSFAKSLMRMTGGRGVDVVLNSLVGDLLKASFECLAPFGRFIEIGKKDIYSNANLPMFAFSRNLHFHAIDGTDCTPDMLHEMAKGLEDLWSRGKLGPAYPLHVYGVSEVEQAFRYLQSGNNTGKTVIEMRASDMISILRQIKPTYEFSADASYVIAGGLGGIGRTTARWMVSRGARNLILLSRYGPRTKDAEQLVAELIQQEVRVETPACDPSHLDRLESLFVGIRKSMPPVKGCVVASVSWKDAYFPNMTYEQWSSSLSAKYQTTWNLHRVLPQGMDFFILFSSVGGVLGAPTQANYAAGNAFQDAFARYRNTIGEKAISLDLGVMVDEGILAEDAKLRRKLNFDDQFIGVTRQDLFAFMDRYCDPNLPAPAPEQSQIVIGIERPARLALQGSSPFQWMQRPEWRHFFQMSTPDSAGPSESKTEKKNYAKMISEAHSITEATEVVEEALIEKLSHALAISTNELDPDQALQNYGIDSLVAVELRNWFRRDFGVDVAVFDVLNQPSLTSLARMIADKK